MDGTSGRPSGWIGEPARHSLAARGVPSRIRLYHGSHSKNIPSIKKHGILPRGKREDPDKIVDGILAEYGLTRADVPDYIWKYPLARLKETEEHIYLSADIRVARANALAGFEAEDMMRRDLARHLGLSYEEPKRDISICEVDVPAELVDAPVRRWGDDPETKWQMVERLKQHIGDLYEDEEDVVRHVFNEVRLDDPIPPEWVKECNPPKSSRARPRPTKVYHVTDSSHVPQILSEGLKPFAERETQGGVVWFWETKSDAEQWARLKGQDAIIEVDVGKDIYRGDIVPRGVMYAKKPIAAERIRRVS